MIIIIVMTIVIRLANKSYKKNQYLMQIENQRRYKQIQAIQTAKRKEAERIAREKEKTIKQYERLAKQAEKEKQQAEKTKQKKQQAEADKIFIENQLNQLNKMLIQADKELSEIEFEIKKCYELRSYNKISNLEKQKPLIVKRIMTLETRVHTAEARLAKANYIIKAG